MARYDTDLGTYRTTDLEDWINAKYAAAGIATAAELTMERVADLFGVEWRLHAGGNKAYWDDEYALILLNENLEEAERREAFYHELCHPVRHCGNQHRMGRLFVELQEFQAGRFQLYAAMPYPYVAEDVASSRVEHEVVDKLARELILPHGLVERRVRQIRQRLQAAQQEWGSTAALARGGGYQRRRRQTYDMAMESPASYGPETERLLAQLYRQTRL